MRTNFFLRGDVLTNSPRRSEEIQRVLCNIGKIKNNVDTSFGEHQWAVVIFNGLHTSRTRQRHSTVFGFVQGGERFYFQCWAAHIFEDGRTEMFSDYDRELDLEDLTPITFVARNGSVAHTVIYETDGWYTME
ncbi:uncharacterized protein LACBIDRAFT_335356 [Laccaria bicolor S238N-H82]|uniref:Predicted protein n=1 Tax=Laccaria bicolor (strain S238N-H82 / ATCC MYA-4686) TaxID=486041 RepID=B0E240_LACBS|nr:uncharacterized protein LACBIDRAFT_335356 [Laccaria bicolor S238N-H82]EDQ99128.1 predicted protein [Laccaria bicolor S238N-H82]|eukprot:XP_001890261.1 predicted protein [Laccaria bicolor S238N-H82]